MQLTLTDYTVLVTLYMVVSLRGNRMLGFNKLSKALPFDRASSNVLLHGLIFIALIAIVGVFSGKVATFKTMFSRLYKKKCGRKVPFYKRETKQYCKNLKKKII